jgi:hypothetical protein
MKIILLHGDDTKKSYERLTKFINEAKKRGWEIVNDKIEDTRSLFDLEKLIIIRDIKLVDEKSINLINKLAGTLVIYSEKRLSQNFLKILPNDAKIEKFELPILIWKFLDNFNIKLFHELLKTTTPEYLLAMISWKLKKNYLKNQNEKTASQIQELSEIDIKAKTTDSNLLDLLDLFLIKNYS